MRIFAKLEEQNPTGSIKDRVALSMVEAAEDTGELEPGQRILEPTSGNTGIALAMIGTVKGYPVSVVMPESATPERVELLRMYGAEIVFSPGNAGLERRRGDGALDWPSATRRSFMPFQYANEANPAAHYCGTALEILEQVPDGQVDAFVAGLGTGGTLMGCWRRLREHNPDVQIVAAEPLQGDPVMGLRSLEDGYTPPILDIRRARPQGARLQRRGGADAAQAARPRGHLRRRLGRRGAGGRPPGGGRDGRTAERGRAVRRRRLEVHERAGIYTKAAGPARARDGRARLVVIPAAMRDEIVAHARAGLPNEACGIIAGLDGRVERFFPAQPDEPSPYYYRIESRDQIRIMNEIDDAGLDLIGIYHSHTSSPAYPSRTDAEQAFWPDATYVIVSLAGGERRRPRLPDRRHGGHRAAAQIRVAGTSPPVTATSHRDDATPASGIGVANGEVTRRPRSDGRRSRTGRNAGGAKRARNAPVAQHLRLAPVLPTSA